MTDATSCVPCCDVLCAASTCCQHCVARASTATSCYSAVTCTAASPPRFTAHWLHACVRLCSPSIGAYVCEGMTEVSVRVCRTRHLPPHLSLSRSWRTTWRLCASPPHLQRRPRRCAASMTSRQRRCTSSFPAQATTQVLPLNAAYYCDAFRGLRCEAQVMLLTNPWDAAKPLAL